MTWKREVLKPDDRKKVVSAMQPVLTDLIDLSLQLKQAHWCVKGMGFLSLHEQLDVILESTRTASDEVAERMVMLGEAPQGHSQTVAESSRLEKYADKFVDVSKSYTMVADRLDTTIRGIRKAIGAVGDPDPITEDLLIGISADLEKHLWMIQSTEGEAG